MSTKEDWFHPNPDTVRFEGTQERREYIESILRAEPYVRPDKNFPSELYVRIMKNNHKARRLQQLVEEDKGNDN